LKSSGNTEVIRSFKDARAEAIFEGRSPGKRFPADIIRVARRKLIMIAEARVIEDLRVPPANRLEALRGDRAGQHSIRINDQWRICFVWTGVDAEDVEITDYH
jgi:proteic killer suppression protein